MGKKSKYEQVLETLEEVKNTIMDAVSGSDDSDDGSSSKDVKKLRKEVSKLSDEVSDLKSQFKQHLASIGSSMESADHSSDDDTPAPRKTRGPGRPPKKASASAAKPKAKRSPGRPAKKASASAAKPKAKRAPGRPAAKKTAAPSDGTTRRRGRPSTKVAPPGDDLTAIDGIGAGLDKRIRATGITTYAEMAKMKQSDWDPIMEAAGRRYGKTDPMPWTKAAGQLAKG